VGDARGPSGIRTHELFKKMENAHNCSAAVLALPWAVQRGISVVAKSSNKSRIEVNRKLVTLTDKEMKAMNKAHQTIGKIRSANEQTTLRRHRSKWMAK
jgi:glycerol 2-dehydrogenase (NADP+)